MSPRTSSPRYKNLKDNSEFMYLNNRKYSRSSDKHPRQNRNLLETKNLSKLENLEYEVHSKSEEKRSLEMMPDVLETPRTDNNLLPKSQENLEVLTQNNFKSINFKMKTGCDKNCHLLKVNNKYLSARIVEMENRILKIEGFMHSSTFEQNIARTEESAMIKNQTIQSKKIMDLKTGFHFIFSHFSEKKAKKDAGNHPIKINLEAQENNTSIGTPVNNFGKPIEIFDKNIELKNKPKNREGNIFEQSPNGKVMVDKQIQTNQLQNLKVGRSIQTTDILSTCIQKKEKNQISEQKILNELLQGKNDRVMLSQVRSHLNHDVSNNLNLLSNQKKKTKKETKNFLGFCFQKKKIPVISQKELVSTAKFFQEKKQKKEFGFQFNYSKNQQKAQTQKEKTANTIPSQKKEVQFKLFSQNKCSNQRDLKSLAIASQLVHSRIKERQVSKILPVFQNNFFSKKEAPFDELRFEQDSLKVSSSDRNIREPLKIENQSIFQKEKLRYPNYFKIEDIQFQTNSIQKTRQRKLLAVGRDSFSILSHFPSKEELNSANKLLSPISSKKIEKKNEFFEFKDFRITENKKQSNRNERFTIEDVNVSQLLPRESIANKPDHNFETNHFNLLNFRKTDVPEVSFENTHGYILSSQTLFTKLHQESFDVLGKSKNFNIDQQNYYSKPSTIQKIKKEKSMKLEEKSYQLVKNDKKTENESDNLKTEFIQNVKPQHDNKIESKNLVQRNTFDHIVFRNLRHDKNIEFEPKPRIERDTFDHIVFQNLQQPFKKKDAEFQSSGFKIFVQDSTPIKKNNLQISPPFLFKKEKTTEMSSLGDEKEQQIKKIENIDAQEEESLFDNLSKENQTLKARLQTMIKRNGELMKKQKEFSDSTLKSATHIDENEIDKLKKSLKHYQKEIELLKKKLNFLKLKLIDEGRVDLIEQAEEIPDDF